MTIEERIAACRAYLHGDGEPLPNYTNDEWLSIIQIKLGQATHQLTGIPPWSVDHSHREALGIEELIAAASGIMDAIEAIEART